MHSLLHILAYVATGATLLVNVLALWKGAGAERHAALTVFISIPAQLGLVWLMKRAGVPAELISVYTDIALSIGIGMSFLWAAMRFQSPWIGVAFLLQGVELAISAYVLGEDFSQHRKLYFTALNLISILTTLVIAGATTGSIIVQRKRDLTRFERQGSKISVFKDVFAALGSIRPPLQSRRRA